MERSFKGPDGGNPESPFNLNRGAITAPPPGKGPPPLTPPATQAAAGGGGMERQSELRNYEISKAVRQVVDQPGKIKRLFVAVAVDGIYKGKIFSPRSTEELRQLASLLKKTVGFDTERGDQFEITSVPLASATPEGVVAVSPPGGWQESLMSSLKVGLLVLLVLGGLMFLLKKRRAGSKPSLLEAPSVPGLPAPAGVQVTLSGEEAAAALPPVPGVQPVLTLPDLVQGQDRVALLIANYPERALEVLRLWLHEKTK
jgi:flagellar M-ring protein FliF